MLGAAHLLGPGVGGHDDDDVAEIGLAAVVVGERAVIHHLQQQVEDVRMRLLDLIEQQHAVRMLGDRLGEQAALVEADVARRRADQARHRVPLHVLGHVEADELDAHGDGELARDLGLADAGGAGEQEAADGLALIAEARARHLDGRAPAPRWPGPGRTSTSFRLRSRFFSTSRSEIETFFGGMRAMRATTSSICVTVDRRLALRRPAAGAGARRPRRPRRWPCRAGAGR